jgi:hypothetical protein
MSRENATQQLHNSPAPTPPEGSNGAQSPQKNTNVPRLALSKAEAAAALGVSVDFLEAHVMPDLRVVRAGRKVLVPLAELQRWLDRNASGLWGAA